MSSCARAGQVEFAGPALLKEKGFSNLEEAKGETRACVGHRWPTQMRRAALLT